MKKTLFLTLLVMGFLTSLGQKNFIPGYVVKPDGDTVYGMIDYQNWRINPVKITFLVTGDSVPVDYRATQIKGFCVNDKIYEGAVVQVETSPNDDQRLLYDGKFIFRTDSVFLNVRFRGLKEGRTADRGRVYGRNDDDKSQFFGNVLSLPAECGIQSLL